MTRPPVNNPLGIAWMLGAAVAFSGLFVAVRELGSVLPTFEILFLRSVFTIVLMAPWLWQERLGAFRARRPGLHLLRGASTFTAMSMLFYGVAHSPLADASALQSTYPLFTILLVALFVGERPGLRRILAAMGGFAGILVIGTGSIGFFLDFDNRRSEYDKLLRMALTDNLTGLPNRNAYIDDLSDKISSATRNTSKLAVIGIDLNRFKDINDT